MQGEGGRAARRPPRRTGSRWRRTSPSRLPRAHAQSCRRDPEADLLERVGGRRDVTREAEPRPEPERGHHVPHGCILPHEALRAAGSPSRRGLSVTARAPGAADGLGAGPRSTSCTLCGPRPCCASSRVLHSSALLRESGRHPGRSASSPPAQSPRLEAESKLLQVRFYFLLKDHSFASPSWKTSPVSHVWGGAQCSQYPAPRALDGAGARQFLLATLGLERWSALFFISLSSPGSFFGSLYSAHGG